MPVLMQVLFALVGLGLAVLIWASLIERHWYAVRQETLAVLPAGSKPMRILHIGDVHLAPWQKRKMRFISELAELKPDLVVDTGDNLGHVAAVEPLLKTFEPLLATPGVFVNGSNDYYAPKARNPLSYLKAPSQRKSNTALNTAALVGGFEKAGWLNLNNRGGVLDICGTRLGFIGIDDAHDGLDDLSSLAASVAANTSTSAAANTSTSAAAKSGVELLIGVSHAPYLRVIDAMGQQKVDLMLAGHTHGGQVCLPWFGALVTNCDLPRQNAKGLSAWKVGNHGLLLNVVAGLGHSIYAPVRLACRPEVRVLDLIARV